MMEIQGNLKLNIKTWSRDSHGLFDYEAPTTKTNQLIINNNCKLIRKKNDVRIVQENHEIEFEERELAKIYFDNLKIIISNPLKFGMNPTEINISDLQNKIWYVIKHDENSQENSNSIQSNGMHEIKLNEIIKLGRVKYAITEIKLDQNTQTIDKNIEKPVFQLVSEHKNLEEFPSQEIICKICYSQFDDESDPMINLCKCTGSISYIHFNCLKKWMNTKLTTKENEKKSVLSYSMKSFNCEICMTPYPYLNRPKDKNYIILESLNQLKDKNNYKSIQIITLKENEKILMGRGHDTDVRINDISVSRSHAELILMDNKMYIKDLQSKFGTLVLAQKDIEFKNKKINLQIGRSYIEFTLTKENSKNKKDINGLKFPLCSSQSGFSVEEKFNPIFKFEDKKNIKNDNINITSSITEIECDKLIQIQPTTSKDINDPNNKKNSALGNFRTQNGNVNIFTVTNSYSKTSSSSNLTLNENQNNNINNVISTFNPKNQLFKVPLNEKSNTENHLLNKNIKNELASIDSNKNVNFSSKQINILEDSENKSTIIQNPLIENNKNTQNSFNNQGNIRNSTNKFCNEDFFSLGIFDTSSNNLNNQNSFMNKSQNLFSYDLKSMPNELINGLLNTSHNNNLNNPLLNSISKNLQFNINNQPNNLQYMNPLFNNNEQNFNLQMSNNQEVYQIQNQLSNSNSNLLNNNLISHGIRNEMLHNQNLFNSAFLDYSAYEMKLNLLNSLNNLSNSFNNINNQSITQIQNQFGTNNLNHELNAQNSNLTFENNKQMNLNIQSNINNINNNNFFLNNFYPQRNIQTNMNINEIQSFKTDSNDIENN